MTRLPLLLCIALIALTGTTAAAMPNMRTHNHNPSAQPPLTQPQQRRQPILTATSSIRAAAEQDKPTVGAPPEIIRGVNLGGWLVLEPWITPSLFAPFINASEVAVDEYTFCAILGAEEASKQLQVHWDGWVTRSHLQELASAGITHLRIPVGYWIVSIEQFEPFVSGAWPFLTRALEWASELGLKVLIDLHGAPGSQNGFDNSGRRGPIEWDAQPPVNLYRTLSVLANLTGMLAPWSAAQGGPVVAIELLNEPFVSVDLSFVQNYYNQGYSVVRSNASQTPPFDVFIHDSFRLGAWGDFMQPPAYQNVWLDTHVYHVFDLGLLRMNESQHLSYTCDIVAAQQAAASKSLWLVTGEWSLATTDCATWLNGMLKGARWDGTLSPSQPALGSCTGDAGNDASEFDEGYKAFLREMAESQMEVYEGAGPGSAGWFFWNFRAESSPQWDFLLGLSQGWIPNPVSNRSFSCATQRGTCARQATTKQNEGGGEGGGR